eukprot:2065335-Rhodomonas_salina.2
MRRSINTAREMRRAASSGALFLTSNLNTPTPPPSTQKKLGTDRAWLTRPQTAKPVALYRQSSQEQRSMSARTSPATSEGSRTRPSSELSNRSMPDVNSMPRAELLESYLEVAPKMTSFAMPDTDLCRVATKLREKHNHRKDAFDQVAAHSCEEPKGVLALAYAYAMLD